MGGPIQSALPHKNSKSGVLSWVKVTRLTARVHAGFSGQVQVMRWGLGLVTHEPLDSWPPLLPSMLLVPIAAGLCLEIPLFLGPVALEVGKDVQNLLL